MNKTSGICLHCVLGFFLNGEKYGCLSLNTFVTPDLQIWCVSGHSEGAWPIQVPKVGVMKDELLVEHPIQAFFLTKLIALFLA